MLTGSAQPNVLQGGGGNDTLEGLGGADVLDGGADFDNITYATRGAAVNVSIGNGPGDGEAGENDDVLAVESVTGTGGNDTLTGSDAGGEQLLGGGGNDELDGGRGADTLDGGEGSDRVSYAARPAGEDVTASLDGVANDGAAGEGDQILAVELLRGGGGNDRLQGSDAADELEGGDGDDTLIGGGGADRLAGQGGSDTASWEERSSGVTATLNGNADDGGGGEGDKVETDIENLRGGGGNDTFTGDGNPNTLQGGDGDDVLDGGDGPDRLEGGEGKDVLQGAGGTDALFGGGGDDTLTAFDGLPEDVDCGDGGDTRRSTSSTGRRPARTVNRLGEAPPPPPNLDPDGDGAVAPGDCDQGNAAIRPGAVDVPQNGVDEDCNGADAPFARINSPVANRWAAGAKTTKVTRLIVSEVPTGGKVEVRCTPPKKGSKRVRARACQIKRRTFTPTSAGAVNLTRRLNRAIPVGTVLEIRITAPASIGKVLQFTVRPRKVPASKALCLPPGAASPRRC